MGNGSPYRKTRLILFLVLASIIIISPQFQMASAGSGGDGDIDQDSFTPNEGDCDDNDPNVYPGHGSCEVPIQEINDVISDVQQLAKAGEITGTQAKALLVKLESAIKNIESDQINAAIGSLNAFINQIKALMPKIIDPSVGEPMIQEVQRIIDILKMG